VPTVTHYRDITRDELIDLIHDLQSAALDLGQHLAWMNGPMVSTEDNLRVERREGYEQAERMAYAISTLGMPEPGAVVSLHSELKIDEE
jgi:hypothetical protein